MSASEENAMVTSGSLPRECSDHTMEIKVGQFLLLKAARKALQPQHQRATVERN